MLVDFGNLGCGWGSVQVLPVPQVHVSATGRHRCNWGRVSLAIPVGTGNDASTCRGHLQDATSSYCIPCSA